MLMGQTFPQSVSDQVPFGPLTWFWCKFGFEQLSTASECDWVVMGVDGVVMVLMRANGCCWVVPRPVLLHISSPVCLCFLCKRAPQPGMIMMRPLCSLGVCSSLLFVAAYILFHLCGMAVWLRQEGSDSRMRFDNISGPNSVWQFFEGHAVKLHHPQVQRLTTANGTCRLVDFKPEHRLRVGNALFRTKCLPLYPQMQFSCTFVMIPE